jgi:hypothetical protein
LTARTFTARAAVREQVPLLVGLVGPSGSGKTFSALRMASGIQAVTGGEIFFIDTEARRALHYAEQFKFQHVEFGAPFGSLDYLAAIAHCVSEKAGVVVVDSMSHEHEGPGGLLDAHETELTRMAGQDYGKRERMQMLAWQKPKAARRQLLNGIVQLGVSCIMCFRAGEKTKPMKDPKDGKTKPVDMGFTPIAGPEFVYEMTMSALLHPRSDGVPTWNSEHPGERMAMKLPGQFRDMFGGKEPLSEKHGKLLAEWARGGVPAAERAKPAIPGMTSGSSLLTLEQRTEMAINALRSAESPEAFEAAWSKCAKLRAELDSKDPDRLAELEYVRAEREEAFA